MSAPILLNLVFFALLAMISGGLYNYSVVALGALYGTPVTTANAALSGNLLLSAIGVLMGGLLVGRTTRHGMVATIGLAAMALFTALIAEIDLGTLALIAVMSLVGLFSGIIMPSRDMIVREVTPPGSFGKVFGFVTTGFNIGGIVSPLIFGAIMDHGSPRLVFLGGSGLEPGCHCYGRNTAAGARSDRRVCTCGLVKLAELPHVRGLRMAARQASQPRWGIVQR